MPGKITRINNEASNADGNCNTLLEEFTSICKPDESSSSSANEQSFQLSVEQVCERVDSAIKLKFCTVWVIHCVCITFCSRMCWLWPFCFFTSDKLDGISAMSDLFSGSTPMVVSLFEAHVDLRLNFHHHLIVDGRVDAKVEDWLSKHTPKPLVRKCVHVSACIQMCSWLACPSKYYTPSYGMENATSRSRPMQPETKTKFINCIQT